MSDENDKSAPGSTSARPERNDAGASKANPPSIPNPDEAADMRDEMDFEGIPAAQLREIIETLQTDLEQARNEVEAREAELETANEKVLRSYAEIENMRKRVEREKEDTAKYAITKFARDIVLVVDNFERAVASVPAEARTGNQAVANLLEGVSLTEREFLNTLERHGVKRVSPNGEPFNPHLHQAVMEKADPGVPSGTVLQVFQVGYLIDDRVLRPAMVVVSTGGPKAPKPTEPQPEGEAAPEAAPQAPASGQEPGDATT